MISVCIATYNGEKYIKEQIDSIICQLHENDEIIISDDGSIDNTLDVIKQFADDRIKIYKNQRSNKGVIGNFENAIKLSSGEYIFLADQDDIWLPNKVNIYKKYFDLGYNIIVSDAKVIDQKKNVINESFFKIMNSGKGFIKNFISNTYLGCCIGFRRELIHYALPFPKSIAMHDIWLGFIGEAFGKPVFINERLLLYRRHGSNASPASEASNYSLIFKLFYRVHMLFFLFVRILKVIIKRNKLK